MCTMENNSHSLSPSCFLSSCCTPALCPLFHSAQYIRLSPKYSALWPDTQRRTCTTATSFRARSLWVLEILDALHLICMMLLVHYWPFTSLFSIYIQNCEAPIVFIAFLLFCCLLCLGVNGNHLNCFKGKSIAKTRSRVQKSQFLHFWIGLMFTFPSVKLGTGNS